MTFIPLLSTSFATQRPDDFYIAFHTVFNLASEGLQKAHRWCLFMILLLGSETGVSTV